MDLEVQKYRRDVGGESGSILCGIVGRSIFVMLGPPVKQNETPDTNLA